MLGCNGLFGERAWTEGVVLRTWREVDAMWLRRKSGFVPWFVGLMWQCVVNCPGSGISEDLESGTGLSGLR